MAVESVHEMADLWVDGLVGRTAAWLDHKSVGIAAVTSEYQEDIW